VRLYGSRTAQGRGRGEALLRLLGASGAGIVAERVAERASASSQPAPARVSAASQRPPQRHAAPWQKKRARMPPMTVGLVTRKSRAAPALGNCTTSGAARNLRVDQVCAFIHEYVRQDELKLPLPQQDGPHLLGEGLVLSRCGAAAVELADVEVELERSGWTRKLVRETQRSLVWLVILCIVVRLTLADSNTVLLACCDSLRLFSCSYFALIWPWAVVQPNLLARRSHPLICGLPRLRRGRSGI
jgi:hypothetical protein